MILLIVSVSCLSLVSADNDTNDTDEIEQIEDLANYIIPSSIIGDKIEFSDGFAGFCLDSAKKVDSADRFTSQGTTGNENKVKLAIIECYKEHKENEIGSVISKVLAKDTSDPIAAKVLSSNEQIADHAVVKIDNTTEGTFEFELLKSSADDRPDCIGYKVSQQTVISEDTAAENDANDTVETANETVNNQTDNTNKTTNNETNKTDTVIITKTNTTVIKQNTTKIITKDDTPQNATIQEIIMKGVGNPIFILIVVFAVIAIIGVAMRRR
ncbi:hypothetical protein [Methanobrevibacter sp.]